MMGDRRRTLGRFGNVRRLASAAAIAILAVSPAIAPMASPDFDGIGLAITEAVFGEPVHAQEPPCKPPPCILAAQAEFLECLDRNPWYKDGLCWVARQLAILACVAQAVTR